MGCAGPVAKNAKKFEIVVDTRKGRRLYTPHNEGGAPLATETFALVKSREPRERHSTGSEAKSDTTHDIAFAVSVL
jgi:hypothetical protein